MLHDPRDLKDERHAAEEDGLQDMNDGEFEDGYQDGLDHLEGFGYLDEDPIQFEDPEENEDRAKDRASVVTTRPGSPWWRSSPIGSVSRCWGSFGTWVASTSSRTTWRSTAW